MSTDRPLLKSYVPPPVDRTEILRYAGIKQPTAELLSLLEDCLAELLGILCFRVVYCTVPVLRTEEGILLGAVSIPSHDLSKNLRGCDRAILFAATLGEGIDRLMARYAVLSPARELLLQAIGTERIEALCDRFCEDMRTEVAREGRTLRPRFSPGYGDLPLAVQRELFAYLDCARRIGLCLNESLLMSPLKSVTAIVGIQE